MSRSDIYKDGKKTQFKPGQINNPKGYPKGKKNRSTILKKWINTKCKFKDPFTKEEISALVEDKVALSLINKALKGDVQAIKEINDTLYGKIQDKNVVEHSGEINIPIIKWVNGIDKDQDK